MSVFVEASNLLIKSLDLKRPPVAISLLPALPEGISLLKEPIRFCEMWVRAMEGEVVLATAKEESCGGGAFYLGLADMDPAQRDGTLLSKMIPLYKSPMAAIRTGQVSPAIPKGTGVCVVCAPLDKAKDVDVCLVVCNPEQAMKLFEAMTFYPGGAIEGLTGPATCSVAVAGPYLTGRPTFNVADVGARDFMKLKDDEMLVGIPGDMLPSIAKAIEERAGHV